MAQTAPTAPQVLDGREAVGQRAARGTRILAIAQALSQLGDQISRVALVAVLWAGATAPPLELLRLVLIAGIPAIGLGFAAGRLADRMPSRALLIATDVGRALVVASFPFLHAASGSTVPIYLALPIVLGLNRAFRITRGRLLPEWVDRDRLAGANALLLGVDRSAEVLGAAVAGALVLAVGWRAAFFIDAGSYLLSAVVLLGLPKVARAPRSDVTRVTPGTTGPRAGATLGAAATGRERAALMGLAAVVALAAGALVPWLLDGLPLAHGERAPVITGALMAAASGGAILAAWVGRRGDAGVLRLAGAVLLTTLALSQARPDAGLLMLVALGLVAGFGAATVFIGTETRLQRESPRERLGRELAWRENAERGTFLVGLLIGSAVTLWGDPATTLPLVILGAGFLAALAHVAARVRGWTERDELPGHLMLRILTALGAAARAMPIDPTARAAAWIGSRTERLHRRQAPVILRNRTLAGVPTSASTISDVLAHYARFHHESALLAAGRATELVERFEFDGWHHLERAHAAGNGVILVTAHLGNWDLGGAVASRRLGVPILALAEEVRPPELFERYRAIRARAGVRVVSGRSGWREAVSTLEQGGVVAVLADRPQDGGAVEVDGSGGQMSFPTMAYRLALRTGAPWVPAVAIRKGNGYLLRCAPPQVGSHDGGGGAANLARAAQAFANVLMAWIREAPDQWIQLAPTWTSSPDR